MKVEHIVEEAPGFEQRVGTDAPAPAKMLISFEPGFATRSAIADTLSVDTWDAFGPGLEPIATLALRMRGAPVALHIGQSATDLRSLATALMRAADTLDGGKGQQ